MEMYVIEVIILLSVFVSTLTGDAFIKIKNQGGFAATAVLKCHYTDGQMLTIETETFAPFNAETIPILKGYTKVVLTVYQAKKPIPGVAAINILQR